MTLGPNVYRLIEIGPLVEVVVMHHPESRSALKHEFALWGGEEPSVRLNFLVDTGAPHSLIDQQIVDDMKLEPTGAFYSIRTPAGVVSERPGYRVEMHLMLRNGAGDLPTTVIGLPTSNLSRHYRGVLGRSSLQKARFIYDGAAGSFDIELVG